MTAFRLRLAIGLALACSACAPPARTSPPIWDPTGATAPRPGATPGAAAVSLAGGAAVAPSPSAAPAFETADLVGALAAPEGLVAVPPAQLVSDQTGSLVSDQTGSLVSDQTGSLVSDQTGSLVSDQTGSYGVLGLPAPGFRALAVAERLVAGTTVYLADATMRPIRRLRPVTTDADGRFRFPAVPRDVTFQVVAVVRAADGQLGRLSTLARPGDAAAISAASTLVAAATLPADGLPGRVDPTAFRRAVEEANATLSASDLPTFADRGAVAVRAAALAAARPALADLLSPLRAALAVPSQTVAELEAGLPAPAPAAAASADPTAAGTTTGTTTTATATTLPPVAPAPDDPGMVQSAAPGECSAPVTHAVALTGTHGAFPITLVITTPTGAEVARAVFGAADAQPTVLVPEGCPHLWTWYDPGNMAFAGPTSFVVRVGAPNLLVPSF